MSTLVYAEMTNMRQAAQPSTSTTTSPPGIKTYADALAALVPAEVLTLHALILSKTTQITGISTQITDLPTLKVAFWGLIVLSVALYVGPRLLAKMWDRLDMIRLLIPPLAFVGWAMLQRTTAFDAAFPLILDAPRTVSALFLGAILGVVAAALAYKADQKKLE